MSKPPPLRPLFNEKSSLAPKIPFEKKKLAKKNKKNWLVPDRKCIWHLRVKLSKIGGKY